MWIGALAHLCDGSSSRPFGEDLLKDGKLVPVKAMRRNKRSSTGSVVLRDGRVGPERVDALPLNGLAHGNKSAVMRGMCLAPDCHRHL